MNPITRSWIWEEYLKFISIGGCEKMWNFFKKHCLIPRILWNEEFSLYPSQAATAPKVHISHEIVPDVTMPALCFSVRKPLAVVEILLSETATWLIPVQWFHHLQPRWQLRICGQPPLPETGNAHSLVAHLLVLLTWRKAKGSSRSFRPMFVIILLQRQLILCFAFRGFAERTESLQKKQIWNHLISKRSLAALYCQSIRWQALCLLPRCYVQS